MVFVLSMVNRQRKNGKLLHLDARLIIQSRPHRGTISISNRENGTRRYGNPVSAAKLYVPTKIEAEGARMTMALRWRHYELIAYQIASLYYTSRMQESSTPCCKGDVIT